MRLCIGIGIEHIEDLLGDLGQALERAWGGLLQAVRLDAERVGMPSKRG